MLQKTSIGDQRPGSRDDLATSITAIHANARQREASLGVFIFLVIIAAANAPFSLIPLGPAHSFVPVIQAVMCTANLLTAVFLLVQCSLYPQPALLALAGGFVCSGLFALLHALAFPSAHAGAVQIGDKVNSATWLMAFWQTTFALAVIIYALSKDAGKPINQSGRSTGVEVGVTVACAVMVTGALTWVATAGVGYLPLLHQTEIQRTPLALHVNGSVLLLNAVALAILFFRRYTLLDQWLMVTLVAWLPHLVVGSLFDNTRFSEGWYLGRVYALFAGSSLLVVLLTETLLLHRRYEQHQRQLIAELDHRVKNVLAQVDGAVTCTDSRSIKDFIRSVRGRIQSMAAAHTLLSESRWHSVALDKLVLAELAPYATDTNFRITGTDVTLCSAETQALGKVLHELATNAAKYGALSIPGGQVSVSWDRRPTGPAATLMLLWREHGGPPVASKNQSSYGTDLIRNLIPHELGGTVDLVFAAEGVNCWIEFPLKQA
jgi:two-component sensor histidine kinase